MRGGQLLKVFTGQQPVADVAAVAAELEAEKRKASDACSRIEWLRLQRKTADDFAAAKALDEQIAEAAWTIERADTVIPHLEGRLKAARAEQQAAALARHQAILRKRFPKFRAALLAAVEEQAAAMREHDDAVKELGEHLVARHLPHIAYRGFLLPDLFQIWASEQDRVFAEPLPKPAVVAPRPAPAPVPAKPVEPDHGFGWTRRQPGDPPPAAPEAPPRAKRVPRRDALPTDGTQRQVVLLRAGMQLEDGTYGAIGDVITVPADRAEAMCRNGAADFVTTTTTTGVE